MVEPQSLQKVGITHETATEIVLLELGEHVLGRHGSIGDRAVARVAAELILVLGRRGTGGSSSSGVGCRGDRLRRAFVLLLQVSTSSIERVNDLEHAVLGSDADGEIRRVATIAAAEAGAQARVIVAAQWRESHQRQLVGMRAGDGLRVERIARVAFVQVGRARQHEL